jgi:ATP-dependent DNA helicase RecG
MGGSQMKCNESASSAPATTLATPVQYFKGVGPDRAALLHRLEIRTVGDLLFFFPRDYQTAKGVESVAEFRERELARWIGTVDEIDMCNTGVGKSMLGILVRRDAQYVRALWFNQPYMREKFYVGQVVALEGKPKFHGLRWEFVHPQVAELGTEDGMPLLEWVPIYRLTEGLKQPQVRRWVQNAVELLAGEITEAFPEEMRQQYDLMSIREALNQIHNPGNEQQLVEARRRFAFQELLVMQLALALQREQRLKLPAEPLTVDARIDARIRRLFSFPFTADQEQAIREVATDMAQPIPMNRLLQGDVGTGKTVVAIYAMLLAVAHGKQAVLMAPTEVLAAQHLQTMQRLLKQAHVKMALLAGQIPAAKRQSIVQQIEAGELDLVIGTHAVLQNDLRFARLGLVVIDEQHKFGVRQRAQLREGESQPHYLVMTATPIPRSMALSNFGDLDTSVLRNAPPGRQQVHTYLVEPDLRARWWDFFRRKLQEGRQGYVVVPVVEEGQQSGIASLESVYENLANGELEAFRLGLVHGRMSSSDKEFALDEFRQGKTQVLVATSVIEVGIDVPNATVMTIESGERFGLAQLHQLRGRVSRGCFPGYVCVFADPKNEDAKQRLEAFAATTDGFELAERDFELRGAGEIVGTRQHGSNSLRVADLQRDVELLQQARDAARELVDKQGFHDRSEFARLRQLVKNHHGKSQSLADVG